MITFGLLTWIAMRGARNVRTAADYSVAGRSLDSSGVSWIIVGTLVGGISTIGTVQSAYTHGVSACIFTFGSGMSCFLLGCFFAKALRQEGVITVSEYLGKYFGIRFRYYSSAINSAGMFVHVVAQYLACIAILRSVFGCGHTLSLLFTTLLLGIFVISGGISGAGLLGKIKFFMLYFIMVFSGGLALYKGGGILEIVKMLPADQDMLGFSGYGLKKASIDLFSMIVGVLSTQIYLQAIFSAKDVRQARNGAFISAAVIPPIGILGIIIGLYLRAYYPDLEGNGAEALPFFLYQSFPPVVAALFSAGILLIVLGTGSGLALGVSTNIYRDFLHDKKGFQSNSQQIRLLRLTTVVVVLAASLLVITGLDSTILQWSYMSMGLRGSAVFAGLFILVFCKKFSSSKLILVSLYLLPVLYLLLQI